MSIQQGAAQTDRYDRGGYPGGFYHVMHLFTGGSDPYFDIYMMRVLNVGLAIALGAGVVLLASRPTRRILAFLLPATYVPMGMFLIASINPSGWALTGLVTVSFALHSFWMASTRGRAWGNAALIAAGAALAASARADAALYLILATLAVSALHYRSVIKHPVRLVLPATIAVVGIVVFRLTGQVGSTLSGGLGSAQMNSWTEGFFTNLIEVPSLVLGNTGIWGLGWVDTRMPPLDYLSMIFVGSLVVGEGLRRLSWMKTLVVVSGVLALAGIPLYILSTSRLYVGSGIQPRYLLPLIPVLGLAILTGRTPDQSVRMPTHLAGLVWAMVSGANSLALLINIQRYTTGVDGPHLPGREVEWWTPGIPGPLATWILGSISFAVAAWWMVRLTIGHDPGPTAIVKGHDRALEGGAGEARPSLEDTGVSAHIEGVPLAAMPRRALSVPDDGASGTPPNPASGAETPA